MDQATTEKPFRVGTFHTVAEADRAVRALRAAGFRKDELAVVCADKHKEAAFADLPTPEPGGAYTPGGIAAGGAIGAAIGGLALVATTLATGGLGLLAAGTVLVGGGALGGAFTGAMMARGLEKEIINYYDSAVEWGDILVAVEVHGEGAQARLREAERILAEAGAKPVPLVEG